MRKTFIILAALTLAQVVTAKPISSTQAMRNAMAFLQEKGISVAPNGMRRAPSANNATHTFTVHLLSLSLLFMTNSMDD